MLQQSLVYLAHNQLKVYTLYRYIYIHSASHILLLKPFYNPTDDVPSSNVLSKANKSNSSHHLSKGSDALAKINPITTKHSLRVETIYYHRPPSSVYPVPVNCGMVYKIAQKALKPYR